MTGNRGAVVTAARIHDEVVAAVRWVLGGSLRGVTGDMPYVTIVEGPLLWARLVWAYLRHHKA